jgi:hypothetical protein
MRKFVRNEPVYEYLENVFSEQLAAGTENNWSWTACKHRGGFGILMERSPRLNRLKASYEQATITLTKQRIFCVAPLALLFLSPLGGATCCDTWEEGIGTPPFILTDTIHSCQIHYLFTLYWMLTSIGNYWPKHCVIGCGWTELNMMNPLNAWAKNILYRIDSGCLSNTELWKELLNKFRFSLGEKNYEEILPPMSTYTRVYQSPRNDSTGGGGIENEPLTTHTRLITFTNNT